MMNTEQENIPDHLTHSRGKLKIFLGAVAGVGKTYRMLAEAHRRVERNGEDVVIGIVETHGRPGTTALLPGLEQVPLKEIEYRGTVFHELDTAAVIARNPEWVLVDEFAHTNVPGTIHEKRWQSVEDILTVGINVVTTLNVQHLESLNDVVCEITGVRVRETIPDAIVDAADEIELEDITPDAVINRLKRGDIYSDEKIPQALTNFFRRGNIVALRELALRKTMEEVDTQLEVYIDEHNMPQGKAAHEKIVVCIALHPLARKLIRRGYWLAKRMQGEFSCIHIRLPNDTLVPKQDAILQEMSDLTRNLGGKLVLLQGESVVEEIIRYANVTRATFLVLGQSTRSRLKRILHRSTIDRIMRQTKGIDIVIVGNAIES
jgi:two-component system, OmpR family, sensor histidine kinase KdpD